MPNLNTWPTNQLAVRQAISLAINRSVIASEGVATPGRNGIGDCAAAAASALAQRHVSYGARAEHYPVVGAALLWTLEKGLGEAWTKEVADAWTAAYATLSSYMIVQAYGHPQAAE